MSAQGCQRTRAARVCLQSVIGALMMGATMGLSPLEGVDLEVGPELAAITTEELSAVVEAGLSVLLVDARGPETYAQGHLLGAVNVPADRVEELAATLPQEPVIVVYCGGPTCPHSLLVGRWLVDHGWRKVLHFVQGYPAWQAAGYPVETGSAEPRAVP